jgi:hypothetical protein
MKATLKKWWPSIAHVSGSAFLFLDPSVRFFLAGHAQYSMIGLAVWGVVLHTLTSPKNADIVEAAKQ